MKRLPLYLLLLSYGISFTQGSDTPPPPPPNGPPPHPEGSIDSQILFLLLAGVVLGAYYLRNRKKVHS